VGEDGAVSDVTADPGAGISIDELERQAARSWQPFQDEGLGEWRLRAAEGFTGRANSALPLGEPGRPLDEAVARVASWYRERGLRPMIAVPFPMDGPGVSGVDRFLAGAGWPLRDGPAVVMTGEPGEVARRAAASAGPRSVAAELRVAGEPDEEWLAMYHYRGQELPPIARRLLVSAPWQAFASLRAEGQTIAIGRVASGGEPGRAAGGDGAWAGLTAIEADAAYRRRGLGTAVTAALAALAAGRGLGRLFLQVEHGNQAARALYRGLGFADHHRYHYRIAP
jgi:ribosomal protein S18 acetylase RimI-like enzyme